MNLCRTCKYFSSNLENYGAPFGDCSNPNFVKGYNIDRKSLKLNQILIEDDEGWAFEVGPEFGCIHHEI